ncbi:MAG TPA: AAA family ATPase [Pyrinomonadaceae bacterium]|nr:AAA family ATPase [Pyrinomonadaceae bacterium]
MIYVDRSSVPIPEHLNSARVNAEREKIAMLLQKSRKHLEQTRSRFDPKIWITAKPALLELFNNKCAYCESLIQSNLSADVEHFRPKTGVEEADGTRSHYYYAWLAYEWENMLIACVDCNRHPGKGSKFPVKGSRARLLANVDECRSTEEALLLDPCYDRPEEHLAFYPVGVCAGLTERGQSTLPLLNLNRSQLVEARQETWRATDLLVQALLAAAAGKHHEEIQTHQRALLVTLSGLRPYTAVARAAIKPYSDELRKHLPVIDSAISAFLSAPMRRRPTVKTASGEVVTRGAVKEADPAVAEPRRQYKDRAELPPCAHKTIRRIEVRNFKAIEELDLELPGPPPDGAENAPALMLLGENATGKSSVLEAVALALLGTEQIEKLGLNASKFVRRPFGTESSEAKDPAEVVIYFDGDGEPVRLTIDPQTGRFGGEEQPSTVLLGYGPRRFFSDRRRVLLSHDKSERVRTLFDPLAVVSNPTSWLLNCPQQRFDAAMRALRELLLLPEEALLSRPPKGKRRGAEIMFEVQGEPEPLRRLSEGYKTTIATGVDIMREMLEYWPDLEAARGVVLIDEIDTHLHPRWKMRIVSRMRRAMPHVQFIATTHDPLCLRGLNDGEAQVLRRDPDNNIEQVTDLPNVRGLSVEQLLTSEFFGLYSTEEPEVEEDVARYVALAAKRDRSPDEESELVQYRGLMRDTITLGSVPESRLVQTAASEYLAQQREVAARDRPALKQAAVSKVIDLWKSVATEEEEP